MLKISSVLLVFFTLLVFSCNNKKSPDAEATGKLGSLVIVSGADVHKALSKVYDSVFLKPSPSEPAFYDLLKPDVKEFNNFYSNQRIVLALVTEQDVSSMDDLLATFSKQSVKESIEDPRALFLHTEDVFARHQHIVYLFGRDIADIEKKLLKGRDDLNKMLTGFEVKARNESLYEDSSANEAFFGEIKNNFGLGVQIPSGFKLKKKTGDAYFFLREADAANPKTIGLIVHAYDLKNTAGLSYLSIRAERDSVCRYLVSGEIKGTYMGTSESTYYPEASMNPVMINGVKGMKVKGWWTIRGMSMAGPYIRYVLQVPYKTRLFAFEGFVYQPELELKERDLRLVEAIALSIR